MEEIETSTVVLLRERKEEREGKWVHVSDNELIVREELARNSKELLLSNIDNS